MGCYPVLYKYKAKWVHINSLLLFCLILSHPSLRSFNSSDGINTKSKKIFISIHMSLILDPFVCEKQNRKGRYDSIEESLEITKKDWITLYPTLHP